MSGQIPSHFPVSKLPDTLPINLSLRACLKSTVCRVRTAHQPLKAPEWDQGSE